MGLEQPVFDMNAAVDCLVSRLADEGEGDELGDLEKLADEDEGGLVG